MNVSAPLRAGTADDAIDGVIPARVALPESPEELAGIVAEASRERLQTVVRGGGSKLEWGRTPERIDLMVGTSGLDRLVSHRHGDMTATVQAGASLASFNAQLAEHRQWLPVDSAFENATIGGVIATNDAGPLRHRYGTPRDLLIGITLALTDGRIVKAGGTVVKNVAGYDLGKLVSGSYGTLAVIVDATFKLLPIPLASTTLVGSYSDAEPLARDVAALFASQVELAAFDVRLSDDGRPLLLIRMASSPAATEAQAAEATRLLSSAPTRLTGEEEQALWHEQVRAPWSAGTVVRFSWLPANVAAVLKLITGLGAHGGRVATFAGRVAGAGLLRLEGPNSAVVAAIGALRASAEVAHVVVLRATPAIKAHVDVWGPGSGAIAIARALKRKLDPAGVLGAGRGPV